MAATLEQVNQRLQAYLAAEAAILGGAQEYWVDGLRVRKGDLELIQKEIRGLQADVAALEAGSRNRLYRGVPL